MSVLTWLIALPFATALVSFFLRRHPSVVWVGTACLALQTILAVSLLQSVLIDGPTATALGSWRPPFGITIAADALSALMVLVTAIMGLATHIYSVRDISQESKHKGFNFFYHCLIGGITGAFLTADLFNLYVWFEVMLIASFALLVLHGKKDSLKAALSYVTLNLFSTIVFLTGVGLLYGLTGTLNFADLYEKTRAVEDTETLHLVVILLSVAFAIKAALFPLYFWLPTSYHTPYPAVSAIFAAMLTKVGVYALFRLFGFIVPADPMYQDVLLFWAWTTMGFGVIGAAAQSDVRKILSFHIISQIGYMILGLALYTPLAITGAIFYLVHHIIVKGNLFLIGGVIEQRLGSGQLKQIGGLYQAAPFLSVLFLIPAFSLAGFPPLSGFWAKYLLIQASVEIEAWTSVVVALAVGLLTIYSMTKIWAGAFWKAHPDQVIFDTRAPEASILPIAALSILTVLIGLFPNILLGMAMQASDTLINPASYIQAILEAQ